MFKSVIDGRCYVLVPDQPSAMLDYLNDGGGSQPGIRIALLLPGSSDKQFEVL